MENYSVFASVYDILMRDVPYNKWVDNMESIWHKFQQKPKLVLDLACGTGTITNILANKGYDMIGIDLSYDMLMEANLKKESNILFLNQDMTQFELFGTVDSIICLCDSINYILEEKELLKVFKLANNYLNPKGLFIFDINTEYKFKNILSNNTFGGNYDDVSYIWENFYDEENKINEYLTSFFILDEETDLYEKFEEEHKEKAYSIETLKNIIKKSGLKLMGVYDENLFEAPKDNSQRLYFVCMEDGKGE